MVNLIPILYGNKKYPKDITPKIQEVSAHFDSKITKTNLEYSLHTEYSYLPRKFTSSACNNLSAIKETNCSRVPKLWFNEDWVNDFIRFILQFIEDAKAPKIIEIHPPFSDYCKNLSKFVELYKKFESEILSVFPDTDILIENRYGSRYSGGTFVLSTVNDLNRLAELISSNSLKLRIALDIPQLFSAHGLTIENFSKYGISELFINLKPIKHYIAGIHLWGKCYGRGNRIISHAGTIDSYFKGLNCKNLTSNVKTLNSYMDVKNSFDLISPKNRIKDHFLGELYDLLNDGSKRYFVPEVNTKPEHLQLIVMDLINSGVKFI